MRTSRDNENVAKRTSKKFSNRAQRDEVDCSQKKVSQQEINLEDGADKGRAGSFGY